MLDPYRDRIEQDRITSNFEIMPEGHVVPIPFIFPILMGEGIHSIGDVDFGLIYLDANGMEERLPLNLIGVDEDGAMYWCSTELQPNNQPPIYKSISATPIGFVLEALVALTADTMIQRLEAMIGR